MRPTMYIVTSREGSMCAAVGLSVEYFGAEAHVFCKNCEEYEVFWAQRLAFLRANPNA